MATNRRHILAANFQRGCQKLDITVALLQMRIQLTDDFQRLQRQSFSGPRDDFLLHQPEHYYPQDDRFARHGEEDYRTLGNDGMQLPVDGHYAASRKSSSSWTWTR
jgi:hypothetical protein